MLMKLEFYTDNGTAVHISCKSEKFYNGTIIEINHEKKFIILKDFKLGEVPILFEEVYDIEPYTKPEVKEDDKM